MRSAAASFLLRCVVLVVLVGAIVVTVSYHVYDEPTIEKTWLIDPPNAEASPVAVWFLGSSRTYRHVSPPIVDSIASARDIQVRSVNLGQAGMFAVEQAYNVDQLLDENGPRPELIVLGVTAEVQPLRPSQVRTLRTITYHDLRRAWYGMQIAVTSSPNDPTSVTDRARQLKYRVQLLASHYAAPGRGLDAIRSLLGRTPPPASSLKTPSFMREHRGFYPLDLELKENGRSDLRARRTRFVEGQGRQEFQQRKTDVASTSEAIQPRHRVVASIYERMIRRCHQKGIPVVLFTSPGERSIAPVLRLLERRIPDLNVFRYHRPVDEPTLFEAENWFDEGHLNQRGAMHLSVQIGRDVAAYLRNG